MAHESAPVLVYGATGFTGRLVVDALERAGEPYLVGGRDAQALRLVSGPRCVGIRVADASDPRDAFRGAGCVVSTVGPFLRHGLTVLDAAIEVGVPYVDTTAEQSFLTLARTRDPAAVAAGVTALPSCGVEYLPMFLAAALLGPGPVETWLWLDDFVPTRGSVRSMVAMAGVGPAPEPREVRSGDRHGWAIGIPGAEAVLVHPDCRTHLILGRWEARAFQLGWPIARWFDRDRLADRIADRLTDPTAEQRGRARFTVIVSRGAQALRIDGVDVYASTGTFAAAVACKLARGEAQRVGVLSAGEALDPRRLLAAAGMVATACPAPRSP